MKDYQFRLLCQEMYRIHELILTKKWNELVETVQLQDFTIDDIIFELNDYPGEISIDVFDNLAIKKKWCYNKCGENIWIIKQEYQI